MLYLFAALELDLDDVLPLYLGEDITDEHAFGALAGRGIGIVVADPADPADPEVAGRRTAAQYLLEDTRGVQNIWVRWRAGHRDFPAGRHRERLPARL